MFVLVPVSDVKLARVIELPDPLALMSASNEVGPEMLATPGNVIAPPTVALSEVPLIVLPEPSASNSTLVPVAVMTTKLAVSLPVTVIEPAFNMRLLESDRL